MASVGIVVYNVVAGVGEGPNTNAGKVCHASGVAQWWEHDWYIWDAAGSYGTEI